VWKVKRGEGKKEIQEKENIINKKSKDFCHDPSIPSFHFRSCAQYEAENPPLRHPSLTPRAKNSVAPNSSFPHSLFHSLNLDLSRLATQFFDLVFIFDPCSFLIKQNFFS
jgi:hypothetical protein